MVSTYVVTGGAGFIGSWLVDSLNEDGYQTIVIDYPDDITNMECMRNILGSKQIDGVFHLAAHAEVRRSMANPGLYFHVNAVGTANVAKCCVDYGIKRFVYASSSSVYGDRPLELFTPFKETDPAGSPTSPYAASKRAGELALIPYATEFDNLTILRFFNVYGPRSRKDLALYKFATQIAEGKPITRYGGGNTYRDYTHVTDICSGLLKSMDLDDGLQIINLGGGNPIMLNDMIDRITTLMGVEDYPIEEYPLPPCDPPYNYSDITKAKEVLGWEPKTNFEEGTRKFMEWFKNERHNIARTS